MEENPMATGLSLSLVLLESIDPNLYKIMQEDYQNKAETYKEWQTAARRVFSDSDPETPEKAKAKKEAQEKVMQVQAGLYKALYHIIDDYDKAHNNALNRAIGKALALVIKDQLGDTELHNDIKRLVNVLKPVVTEAVDAAKEG